MYDKLSIKINLLMVVCDYETAERCGASGTFQVETLKADTDYGELDITSMIDQGKHYYDLEDIKKDLNLNDVDIEEY